MGLIVSGRLGERARQRLHTWYWRLRYWWMDTPGGHGAQIGVACLAAFVSIVQFIRLGVAALVPPPPGAPRHAIIWWVVILVVALVAGIIAAAMMPKAEKQQPTEGQGPTTEDGQAGILYWGTHWADDTFLLAWKVVGRDQIKGKGGK